MVELRPAYEVFKVVYITPEGKRVSCCAWEWDYGMGEIFGVEYPPKTHIHAPEGTMGIFCFETYEQAQSYINSFDERFESSSEIISVYGFGKPYRPRFIGQYVQDVLTFTKLWRSKKSTKGSYPMESVPGTICFQEIYTRD